MRAGRPAHPGCTWFSVLGSWFSVRDARAPRGHVVLGSRFLVLGSGRPRSQGARGSRFLVLGSRFGTPAHPGTLSAVAPQGLPGAQRGLQPAVSVCGRDARAPRDALRRSPAGASRCSARASARSLRMRAGRPRTQGRTCFQSCCTALSAVAPQGLPGAQRGLQPAVSVCGRDARAPRDTLRRSPAGASTCSARASARSLRMRARTPAHPGCTWFSVPGSWFSVRDARAPRGHVVLGSRFLVLGSGRPRTQGARGSRFSVLGSRFLVLGSWFLVPGSWFSIRDARTPRDTLRRSPAGASTCSARASARSLRLLPHPFATCSRRNCANTIRPVCV